MGRQATATAERPKTTQAPQEAPSGNLPAAPSKHPVAQFKDYAMERVETLRDLPHIDPLQLISVALTAIQRKPDLMRCTKQSLWNACVMAAQDGLLPDGREGAIVPYGENVDGKRSAEIATWMPMVEGLRKKVRNSGEVRDWYVELVYHGDLFRYQKGDNPRLDHEPVPPSMRTPNMPFRGIMAAYSIAVFRDGTKSAPEVMWIEEIEAVRAKSKAKNGPWQDPSFYPEMCKKVVARRHYKQLPKTRGLDRLIQRDDADYDLDRHDETLVEARQARRLTSTTDAFDQFAAGGPTIDQHTGEVSDDEDFGGGQDEDFGADAAQELAQDAARRGAEAAAEAKRKADEAAAAKQAEADKAAAAEKARKEEAARKAAAAQKEDPISSGPQRAGGSQSAAQASPGGAAQPADDKGTTSAGAQETSGDPDAKAIDTLAGASDEQDDANRRWPHGAVPSNADEYESYADTKIEDFTDAAQVAPWWKSKEEIDLRKACGVQQTMFDRILKKAQNRVAELKKAK
jgi:recombination protein RecT